MGSSKEPGMALPLLKFFFRYNPKENAEKALTSFLNAGTKIPVLFLFSLIAGYKLELASYFNGDNPKDVLKNIFSHPASIDKNILLKFLVAHGHEALLAFVTYIWWKQFYDAVKNEKELLVATYKKMNLRKNIGSIIGYEYIKPVSYIISIIFIFLIYFIDKISVYCIAFIAFCVFDIWGNNKIRTTMADDFWKKGYAPPANNPKREIIIKRAEVLENYWIRKPQLERISIIMTFVSIAFLLETQDKIFGYSIPIQFSYAIVILIILINKQIMVRWREERDRQLELLDEEEDKLDGCIIDG